MVRISDIYKKKKADGAGAASNLKIEIPKIENKPEPPGIFSAVMNTSKDSRPRAESESNAPGNNQNVIGQGVKHQDSKEADNAYSELIKAVKGFYISVSENKSKYFDSEIHGIINRMLDMFEKGDDRLLSLTGRVSIPEYLYSHVANVCILSVRLGLGLGYNRGECAEIGLSAVFHDLGLTRKSALINKVEKLSEHEIMEIKKHSEEGRKIICGFGFMSDDLKRLVSNVVYQSHERVSGAGYPAGVKGENLHNYAQIIGLVDTYEALTHHRAYRGRFLPHDVCRWLVETREAGDDFNNSLIKKFIEVIGIYPVGSFVRLSSGEIAEVVKVNQDFPLRPVVDVVINIEKERQSPPKRADLLENPVLQILGPIDETKIKLKDKKFALYLLTRKWITVD